MRLLDYAAVLLTVLPQHVMSTIVCGKNADIYKDATCTSSQRAQDLLARMSWIDKVKQLGGIRQVLGEDMSFNKTNFDIFNEAQNGNIGYGNGEDPYLGEFGLKYGAFPVAYNWLPSDKHGGYSGSPIYGSSAWQFPAITIEPPMAFGFGLSYTSFNMSFEVKEVADGADSAFEVSVNVTNTGSVAGKEVVQLYFRQSLSMIELPVKRLICFAKVGLGAGQSEVVTFVVPQEELGYYLDMEWTLEKGSYTFYVGSSSKSDDLQEWDVAIE